MCSARGGGGFNYQLRIMPAMTNTYMHTYLPDWHHKHTSRSLELKKRLLLVYVRMR